MGNTEKYFSEKREEQIMKIANEGMEREKFHLKKQSYTITKKKENNSTIEENFDKHGNKASIYETVNKLMRI